MDSEGRERERQDLESVRQSQMVSDATSHSLSPSPNSALFFHFPAGPSDNVATLVNPIEIMYFVEEEGTGGE